MPLPCAVNQTAPSGAGARSCSPIRGLMGKFCPEQAFLRKAWAQGRGDR